MCLTRPAGRTILFAAVAYAASGCFTGVESTPKIKDSEVRKNAVPPTAEQVFLRDVGGRPFGSWRPGKQFYVTDAKIDIALVPDAGAETPKAGDIMSYRGVENATTVTGETAAVLLFDMPDGAVRRYRLNGVPTPEEPLQIPFTVELSTVEETAALLSGRRKLYVTTSEWYDLGGMPRRGLRYVPVEVTAVGPGTHVYPVAVTFANGADTAMVLMNVGHSQGAKRTFDTLFSFDDPHKRYPAITEGNWKMITQGLIKQGMTRDEVRLALGAPPQLDRYPASDGVAEIWQYDDGTYLMFNGDGLLEKLWR